MTLALNLPYSTWLIVYDKLIAYGDNRTCQDMARTIWTFLSLFETELRTPHEPDRVITINLEALHVYYIRDATGGFEGV